MTQVGQDTLGTRSTLTVGGKDYAYYSFAKAAETIGDVSKLPFSLKVERTAVADNFGSVSRCLCVQATNGPVLVFRNFVQVRQRLAAAREKLPPNRIGKHGQINMAKTPCQWQALFIIGG